MGATEDGARGEQRGPAAQTVFRQALLALVCGRLVDDRIAREALGGLPSLVCDLFLQLHELVLVRESALSLSILLVGHSLLVPTRSTL
jgi:hypothetical protein